jgi:hypothetical protein
MTRRAFVAGTVAVLVLVILLAGACQFGPQVIRHEDGGGPLGNEGGAGSHITSARDPQGGR